MALRIVGISGSQMGRSFDLANEITIGRESTCTIALTNDSGVSRQHARFVWIQGLPMIEDLGSRNGTFLNGARITQARPVSSGDEVRIGSEAFRVEAVLDSIPGQVPIPPNQKEVSRGEAKHKRKTEQSGAEGSLYGKTGVSDWNPMQGCALPKIDLSGCLKYLWIILLILIVVIVIGLIISGIATLLTTAGGAASQAVSGTGSGTGTNTQRPTPTPPPPTNQDRPPPQNQNQDKPQQAPSIEGVQIEEVKIDFSKRDGQNLKPIVLVKWLNLTKNPVKKLSGSVQIFDRNGKLLTEIPREVIYSGSPVNPGESHQDTLQAGGIVIQQKLSAPPTSAKVNVERVE